MYVGVILFQNEMSALKADNDRLQRMMHVRPLNSSQNSIAHNRTSSDSLERSLSITEQPSLGKENYLLWNMYEKKDSHFSTFFNFQ